MKREQSVFFISLLVLTHVFLLGVQAEASDYTVKAGGGGNYASISACAAAAVAGDSCTVYAGSYAGWTQPTSGSAGNPITFRANAGDSVAINSTITIAGKKYVTIGGPASNEGFTITTGQLLLDTTSNVIIQNNNITHTSGRCIEHSLNPPNASSYVYVLNNILTYCGAAQAQGIAANGDHWLIDGNTFSHLEDGIAMYGSFNVVRNNHFGPITGAEEGSAHPDALESSCAGTFPLVHMLFEGNVIQDWGATPSGGNDANAHTLLLRDTQQCGMTSNVIRFNTTVNTGSYWTSNNTYSVNTYYYNNSVSNTQQSLSLKDFTDAGPVDHDTGNVLINNLFANMTRAGSANWCIYVDDTSQAGFVENHNLCFNTGWSGPWNQPFSGYKYSATDIFNQDPKFVDRTSNLHLQADSPAIGAGGPLTTAQGAGTNSTALTVADANFFQDGRGLTGVHPDGIRIGASATVQISSIDYSTNRINLASPVSWSSGAAVYLYKDSTGKVVLNGANPDIGVSNGASSGGSSGGSDVPPPPQNLQVIIH